jgi:adenosylhomocysteine nucleosidase
MKKIAIICAMEEELDAIKKIIGDGVETITDNSFIIYKNKFNKHHIHLTLSGIGKVNSSITTQYLISKFDIDYVINVGVAGSLSDDVNFGDVVVADDLVQYDVDVSAFGLKRGQIPRLNTYSFPSNYHALKDDLVQDGINIKYGRIISGDMFVDNETLAIELAHEFNAIACEMEGAAIAHTCFLNKVPILVIRSISDFAGRGNKLAIHSFDQLKQMASINASTIVYNILINNIL